MHIVSYILCIHASSGTVLRSCALGCPGSSAVFSMAESLPEMQPDSEPPPVAPSTVPMSPMQDAQDPASLEESPKLPSQSQGPQGDTVPDDTQKLSQGPQGDTVPGDTVSDDTQNLPPKLPQKPGGGSLNFAALSQLGTRILNSETLSQASTEDLDDRVNRILTRKPSTSDLSDCGSEASEASHGSGSERSWIRGDTSSDQAKNQAWARERKSNPKIAKEYSDIVGQTNKRNYREKWNLARIEGLSKHTKNVYDNMEESIRVNAPWRTSVQVEKEEGGLCCLVGTSISLNIAR